MIFTTLALVGGLIAVGLAKLEVLPHQPRLSVLRSDSSFLKMTELFSATVPMAVTCASSSNKFRFVGALVNLDMKETNFGGVSKESHYLNPIAGQFVSINQMAGLYGNNTFFIQNIDLKRNKFGEYVQVNNVLPDIANHKEALCSDLASFYHPKRRNTNSENSQGGSQTEI